MDGDTSFKSLRMGFRGTFWGKKQGDLGCGKVISGVCLCN
jgi:hypothetical protein